MEENEIKFETERRQQARIDNITDFIFLCLGLVILSLVFKFCWWIIML